MPELSNVQYAVILKTYCMANPK